MTTWPSDSKVFGESSQVLVEDEEGKCNLGRSFKKNELDHLFICDHNFAFQWLNTNGISFVL